MTVALIVFAVLLVVAAPIGAGAADHPLLQELPDKDRAEKLKQAEPEEGECPPAAGSGRQGGCRAAILKKLKISPPSRLLAVEKSPPAATTT